jgi:hypothetical protein
MLTELLVSKKKPRIFSLKESELSSLEQIQILWTDRSISQVYDVSLSGVLCSNFGKIGRFKLGQAVDCKLKLLTDIEMKLRLLVSDVSANFLGLSIDPLNRDSRILLDEVYKEKLIISNLKSNYTFKLHPSLRANFWIHGPFDTNIFLWLSEGRITKCIFEYDHVVWQFENGAQKFYKSQSYSVPPQGYESAFKADEKTLLLGNNWPARAKRVLSQAVNIQSELQIIAPYFQALQEH